MRNRSVSATRRVADDQRVAVVVEKHHETHEPYRYLSAHGGRCTTDDTGNDRRHTAVTRDDANHPANHHGKENDRRMIAIGKRVDHEHREPVEQSGERTA